MRFVVSLLALRPGRVGGTEQHIRGLLAAFPSVLGGDELIVLAGTEAAASVETPGLARAVLDRSSRGLIAARGLEAFTPWRDRPLERVIDALRPDAIFFPQISFFPKALRTPAVVMVGDVQHMVLPHNFSRLDRIFRASIYPYSFGKARLLLPVSERTRRDLETVAGVPADKLRVVRPGSVFRGATRRSCSQAPPIEGRYLYFPAATNRHKGHADLFRAFAELPAQETPLSLVLTGERTGYWSQLETTATRLGIRSRVLHLGYVAPEVVDSLYGHAEAVVFPSRFEGFGLPVAEAASFGAKVIASNLDVFDENGTEGVLRIDFADSQQLRVALESPQRASLAAGVWTWEDAAAATLVALRDAATAGPV